MNALHSPNPAQALPPRSILYLWKGAVMKDPTCGRGLSVHQINSLLKNSQGHTDDLSLLKSEILRQPTEQFDIAFSETNCSFPDITLQNSPDQNKALGSTEAIRKTPEFSSSVTSGASTPLNVPTASESIARKCAPVAPLDWILNPEKQRSLPDRIMARLIQAEAHEENIHFREDYRQTFIFLSRISHGMDPLAAFLSSSYTMYGLHPLKVWEKRMHDRRILLGKEFPEWCDDAGNFRPDIPKKPTLAQQPLPAPAGAVLPTPQTPKPAPVLPFPKKETA